MNARLPALLCFSMLSLKSLAPAAVETVLDSTQPGPTVLVLTDPIGADRTPEFAIDQAKAWTLDKGKLLTAPAKEAESAIKETSPDAVVLLKTSRKADRSASLATRGEIDATALLAKLNTLKEGDGEQLSIAAEPVALPDSVKQAVQVTLIIKNGGSVPAARIRVFRHAIHDVLASRGMTASSPWTLVAPTAETIEVALYAGKGSELTPGIQAFPKIFDADQNVRFAMVGPAELKQPDMLKQFDVMFFCGGMSKSQGTAIGEEGADAVRTFIKNGGGYVGTCAGSYLATSGYKWSLKIVDADVIDANNWLRGSGPVDIELTEEGKQILGDYKGLVSIKYANGPLLGKAKDSGGLEAFTVLAHFRSDMAKSAPGGVMPGTPAIISGKYGAGRVLLFSPHPEYTDGLDGMIKRAVRWVSEKPAN